MHPLGDGGEYWNRHRTVEQYKGFGIPKNRCYPLRKKITLHTRHVPGIDNQECDLLSRQFRRDHDWELVPQAFKQIEKQLGPMKLDMFAGKTNSKCPDFSSWRWDPGTTMIDAFQQDWDQLEGPVY